MTPGIIKNKDELSITALRRQALDIVEAGIAAVLPAAIMAQTVKYDPLNKMLTIGDTDFDLSGGRIFVTGGGKASGLMAETLEKIIGPGNIAGGVVNSSTAGYKTRKIKIVKAAHPTPDRAGVDGVKQMLALKGRYAIAEKDLVICLISGGGSALLPCPAAGIGLQDKQEITRLLISRGPSIHEINAVRKHLSRIKGGQLGRYYSPAKVVSLLLSDVIGNDLDVIASGPAAPDSSTFADAYRIVKKYNLLNEAPASVVALLEKGCKGEIEETPKTLDNCSNYIIGDNRGALGAMAAKAEEAGFTPYIVTAEQKGDPTVMARLRAKEIVNAKYKGYDVLLVGGETTPGLPGNPGKGGRNQHYAAVSMAALNEYPGPWVMAGVGTDGSDFLPDAAGAIVDKISFDTAKAEKIKIQPYLDRYDSNTLLEKIGKSLIVTGSTGTNVGDVAVYIIKGGS